MSSPHQAVLSYIQQHGPIVPNELRQALKLKDSFLTGAILSELMSEGVLSVTHFNHGTSKFYYETAKPESLEMIGKHLGEKDRRAFEYLKEERVVRTAELTPLMRVAVAAIKDFSRSIILQTPDGEQEFAYYYLLDQEQAIIAIKKKFFGIDEEKPVPKQEAKPIAQTSPEPVQTEKQQEKPVAKPKRVRKPKIPQQTLTTAAQTAPTLAVEGFSKQLVDYFAQKNITLLAIFEQKKTESTLKVSIPSAVGAVTYFCVAKAKKTSSDGDLASALLTAQQHKLPLLYIAGGSLTKKASDMLQTQLAGAVVVQPWA